MSDSTARVPDGERYDPNRHDNQIVAVYETRQRAESARDSLASAGIPSSAVEIFDGAATGAATTATADYREGFWGAIKNIFAPEEDYGVYHSAIEHGHAMLVVTVGHGMDRRRAIEVLEASDPVDVDAKRDEWQQSARVEPGIGAAAASSVAGTTAAPSADPVARDTRRDTRTARDLPGDQNTIKVAQERLRIGKREVAQGAVRIRSYVVERPVEENVQLHDSRVDVERRPVDRAASGDEAGLFQERTLEARSTTEEPVIQKETRIVEEVGLRKQEQDRTETVRDTVRETKVDVDDGTQAGRAPAAGAPRR